MQSRQHEPLIANHDLGAFLTYLDQDIDSLEPVQIASYKARAKHYHNLPLLRLLTLVEEKN